MAMLLKKPMAPNKESRVNELTAVMNREKFDAPPGDVADGTDLIRWKDFRAEYHQAQKLESDAPFPLQIDFELTSQCNMRCSFCVHGHERVPKKRLPFEVFKRVIDEGSRYGLTSIKMNYINEPLLVKDIDRYIDYAKSKGVLNIYFATNGTLLSPDMAAKLIEVGTSKVMISLDATTPETFRVMRNSDDFEKIIANIDGLLSMRAELGITYPLVRVNFLKTKLNQHEADDFIERWHGVADMIGFQDQVGVPGVDDPTLGGYDVDDFRCSFPFKMIVIDSGGHLLPCCTFNGRDLALGHIDEMTIKEAWDGEKMRDLRALHKRGGYKENAACLHCINGCS